MRPKRGMMDDEHKTFTVFKLKQIEFLWLLTRNGTDNFLARFAKVFFLSWLWYFLGHDTKESGGSKYYLNSNSFLINPISSKIIWFPLQVY